METLTMSYNHSFYCRDVKRWAKAYLKLLPADVNVLVSMGSSGSTIATAMLVLANRPLYHVYLRKDGENTHAAISDPWDNNAYDLDNPFPTAVVDDFCGGGTTIATIMERLNPEKFKVRAIIVSSQFEITDDETLNLPDKMQKYKHLFRMVPHLI